MSTKIMTFFQKFLKLFFESKLRYYLISQKSPKLSIMPQKNPKYYKSVEANTTRHEPQTPPKGNKKVPPASWGDTKLLTLCHYIIRLGNNI